MKRLVFIILVLAGCAEEEIKPLNSIVSYTDISGPWEFVINEEAKGSFTIEEEDNGFFVSGGTFLVYGTEYTIGKKTSISFLNDGRINTILLETFADWDQTGYSAITIENLKINLDFTIMEGNRVQYRISGKGDGGDQTQQVTRPG